jgi:hypothetical protein
MMTSQLVSTLADARIALLSVVVVPSLRSISYYTTKYIYSHIYIREAKILVIQFVELFKPNLPD